jgi:hypothetical protein
MTPGDLTSDTATTPLTIDFLSDAMPDDAVQAVASAVQLRSYPSLTPLPFAIQVITQPAGPYSYSKQIAVVPSSPIGNHWAVLSISALPTVADLPQGFRPEYEFPDSEPNLGIMVAHFTPAAVPILRYAAVSQTGWVTLNLSERVDPSSAATGVQATVGGTPCTTDASSGGVGFNCPASVYTSGFHLAMHGLRAVGGAPIGVLRLGACSEATLVDLVGFDQDVTPQAWPPICVGCWYAALVEHGPCAAKMVLP